MTDIGGAGRAAEQIAYDTSLADIVDDAVIGTDAEFRLTVWNHGAERLYGYAAEEVLGRDARDVATYAGDASRTSLEGELLETGRTRTEFTAHRKDGTPVAVELVAVAVRDGRGRVTGYLGVHRDMTDRKRAEETLRASHRQIETILESIADAFVAMDREWRYTYVNGLALSRLEAWRGRAVTRGELLGRSMWELFPELDGTEVGARLREAMQAQHPVEFELHFAPTGEWIEAKAYPSTTGLSIHYRNISERKRAAAERERGARRQADVAALGLRALASDDLQPLLDDAVALVARTLDVGLTAVAEILPGSERLLLRAGVGWGDGAVGRVTGTAGRASLVGYTVLAGKPVVADDVAADERFNISPALAERHPVSAVTVVIAGRDEPYGALGAFAQERRSFSEPDVNFMQSVANVLAGAVERSHAYERMIDVRDAERRRIARDLHDEALQDLGETLALAAGGPGTDAPGDALATLVPGLKRVALHLRGAIYDLRLGAEEDRPFLELLEGLVGVHLALADGREVHLDVGRGMPAASLGRRGTEVLSIVGEALVNARRHADARHIRVRVAGSAHRLHVEVSDDGRGFDPDRSPGAGGTGIAGMRERAALLDGSLRVASRPGEGTLIALELPLAAARETAVAEARILLVEDHAAVREAIAAMFEREPDFTVAGQAGTLAEAREMLREVDVAVIDLGLPDGDGASLIADLREASPDAQALVLSASLDREQSARAIESGAAAVLDKAARLDEIVDAVRRLRAGETLLAVDEVIELIRFAGSRRERERGDREALARLTPREREVLQALGEGLDTQAIAERLGISTRTQRNHVASILTKLGVHSQLQAVLFALRYELIQVR